MAGFEDLMIGFNDNGYNTVDSFVDRTKELPTKNVSIYEIDFNPLNDAKDSEEDKIENAEKIHEQGMVFTPLQEIYASRRSLPSRRIVKKCGIVSRCSKNGTCNCFAYTRK